MIWLVPGWLVVDDGGVGLVGVEIDEARVVCDFCDIPAANVTNVPSGSTATGVAE